MEIKAVLFDLDGVLIDTLDCWFQAINDTFRKYGRREISRDEFLREVWGYTYDRALGYLGEEALAYCRARLTENLWRAKLIPGAREVLEFCKNRVRLGLVTNTPRENTLKELEMFGLEYFDVVITADDAVNRKPSPDMVLRACEMLGVPPEKALMVGDTESDVRAGRSAGCRVIGINVDADWKIRDMYELRRLLEKILKKAS